MLCKFLRLLGVLVLFALPTRAQVVPPDLDLGGVKVSIPPALRPAIQARMQALRSDQSTFSQRLAQADLFLPVVGEVLQEQGVPDVFKYLALLDHKNAEDKVFWQLPEAAIRQLGLQDAQNVDESANVVAIAKAVAQNLRQNQGNLKSWVFALLAYRVGAGEAKEFLMNQLNQNLLQNLLLNQKLDLSNLQHADLIDFVAYWALFKDVLGRNPDATTTLARYKQADGKSLEQIAKELNIKKADLAAYNEWIEPNLPIPAGKGYEVLLPLSTASPSAQVDVQTMRGGELEFNTYEEDSFAKDAEQEETTQKTHTVTKGETLFSIARKYNVSVGAIRQWNLMDATHTLKVGDEIKVSGNAPMVTPPSPTDAQGLHTVRAGENIFTIATAYKVTAKDLRAWNNLASDKLTAGQKLTVKAPKPTDKPKDDTPPPPPPAGGVKPDKTLALSYSQRSLGIKKVPSQMTVAGLRLTLSDDAKQKIQKYVDKLIENQPAYFYQLEMLDGYMPLIEREMEKAELPLEFRFLPIQESALKANAVSKSNAVGYWQFKKESAVEEGIVVNDAIDERMNIVASTVGAINYLKKSQLMFGNWLNSLLSYNMGRAGAKNHLDKIYKNQKLFGAEEMEITADTHWYVLKFLAHIIAYGGELGVSTPRKLLTDYTDGAKKTLAQIAQENKTTLEALLPHNQWLKTQAVPVGKVFNVIVPKKK